MSVLYEYIAEHGGGLVAGATCLLVLGCLAVALQRSPVQRQRTGEWTMLAVLVCLVLACVPLPRYLVSLLKPVDSHAHTVRAATRPVDGFPAVDRASENILLAPEPATAKVELLPRELPYAAFGPIVDETLGPVPGVPEAVVRSGVSEPRTPPVRLEPTLPPAEGEPLPVVEAVRHAQRQSRSAAVTNDHSTADRPANVDTRKMLSTAYGVGVLSCCAWLLLGRLFLLRMLLAAQPPESWLLDLYRQIPFPRPGRPRLLVSTRCTRPLSFGIWRPTILLPQRDCRPDHEDSGHKGVLCHVLRHELAHVAQRDAWGHLLFNLAFPVLYFHPLYWWIRSRAYLAAELIADDRATEGTARESYVEALVKLARQRGGRQLAMLGSRQVFGSRSHFFRRMKMLLDRESRLALRCSRRWWLSYPAICLLGIAIVAGAVGVRPADGQQDEPDKSTEVNEGDSTTTNKAPTPAESKGVEKQQTQRAELDEVVERVQSTSKKLAEEDTYLTRDIPAIHRICEVRVKAGPHADRFQRGNRVDVLWRTTDPAGRPDFVAVLRDVEVSRRAHLADGEFTLFELMTTPAQAEMVTALSDRGEFRLASRAAATGVASAKAVAPYDYSDPPGKAPSESVSVQATAPRDEVILPGDYVDVFLFIAGTTQERTVVENVRVFSMDVADKEVREYTLTIPADQAETLKAAAKLGDLSLSKRDLDTGVNEENLSWTFEAPSSNRKRPDETASAAEQQSTVWHALGLALKPMTTDEFRLMHKTRYRGGLAVTRVQSDGPAAKAGVKQGDVLVGLHVWETTSLKDVDFAIRQPAMPRSAKVYLLRGDQTVYGYLVVEGQAAPEAVKQADLPPLFSPRNAAPTSIASQKPLGNPGSWVDVVSLATAYADALGDLETAEVRDNHMKSLSVNGKSLVSQQQADIAKIDIRTAKRKVVALRGIAEAALAAAEAERKFLGSRLALLEETNKKVPGSVPRIQIEALKAQFITAESKLRSVMSILGAAGN